MFQLGGSVSVVGLFRRSICQMARPGGARSGRTRLCIDSSSVSHSRGEQGGFLCADEGAIIVETIVRLP